MSVIGFDENERQWQLWEIEPTAEFALDEFCTGMAFDLTSTLPVPDRTGESPFPPSPVLIFSTTDGKLNPTDFINKSMQGPLPFMITNVATVPPSGPVETHEESRVKETTQETSVQVPKPKPNIEESIKIPSVQIEEKKNIQQPLIEQPSVPKPIEPKQALSFDVQDNQFLRQAQKRPSFGLGSSLPEVVAPQASSLSSSFSEPKPKIEVKPQVSSLSSSFNEPKAKAEVIKAPPDEIKPVRQESKPVKSVVDDEASEDYKKQIQQILDEFDQVLVQLEESFEGDDFSHLTVFNYLFKC